MKQRVYYYNKQIILSELGSMLGGPLGGVISHNLTNNHATISLATLAGAIIGSSIIWMILRIHDEKKIQTYTRKKLLKDLLYFVPAATILAALFVYPTIYYGTKTLLELGAPTSIASSIGPLLGMVVYVAVMNIYRITLEKHWNIKL